MLHGQESTSFVFSIINDFQGLPDIETGCPCDVLFRELTTFALYGSPALEENIHHPRPVRRWGIVADGIACIDTF